MNDFKNNLLDSEITQQTFRRDELLQKYRSFEAPLDKKAETIQLAENLDELISAIETVTEEWQRGGGSTAETDVLAEIKGRDHLPRDESVRSLEYPLALQLERMIDDIPAGQVDRVLKVIDRNNIKVWDDDRAMEKMERIRAILAQKKERARCQRTIVLSELPPA